MSLAEDRPRKPSLSANLACVLRIERSELAFHGCEPRVKGARIAARFLKIFDPASRLKETQDGKEARLGRRFPGRHHAIS
ncbi:MAG: hypothetical protein WA813_05890, partial [Beijerinckiaceae bacterium]